MKPDHFEDVLGRDARRLQKSASRLVDDGQAVVGAKLTEATDIIQGALAHLMDQSQSLIRAKMVEAAHVLEHTRDQAAQGAKVALHQAKDRAQDSYGDWRKLARQRPVATLAVAVAIGLAVGLIFRPRKSPAAKTEAVKADAAAPIKAAARRSPSTRKPKTDGAAKPKDGAASAVTH
jgi:ElaB/YqjD/DUF883 family membrane-anchored ribosome-binding protein